LRPARCRADCTPRHTNIEAAVEQVAALAVKLAEQRRADVSGATTTEHQLAPRLEERLVNRAQACAPCPRWAHDEMLRSEAPWAIAAMLIAVAAERFEHPPGHPRRALHALAHDRGDALPQGLVERRGRVQELEANSW